MNNPLSKALLLALLCGLLAPVAASLRGSPILSVTSEVAAAERHVALPTIRSNAPPSTYSAQQNQTCSYDDDCILLHDLAIEGSLDQIKTLLEEKPHLLLSQDDKGWSALHEAARHAHIQVADYLIQMGADLNARTLHGATPLYEAEKYNGQDSTIYRYLLSMGALRLEAKARLRGGNAARHQKTLPHTLAREGRMDELNQLLYLEGPKILNTKDSNGWTPLHEAARHGQVYVARFLIDHAGAEVDNASVEGATPLYYAGFFQGQDSPIYQLLQAYGALEIGPQ
jgi:ankyrin repeat protein